MRYKKRIARYSALSTLGVIASLTACSAGEEPPVTGSDDDEGARLSSFQSAARLRSVLPRAKVHVRNNQIRRVYGVAATGKTPDASVESFLRRSAAGFGIERADLVPDRLQQAAKLKRTLAPHGTAKLKGSATPKSNGIGLMYDPATGKHKFRLYSYQQQRDGVPVFRAGLRTLVREGGNNPVVWANAELRPMGNFRPPTGIRPSSVDVDKSLRALHTTPGAVGRGIPAPTALADVSAPTPTIFAGVDGQATAPRMAMQYSARAANGPGKWTFVADAVTGDVLHVESNLHFDIDGTVQAEVITGPESMECGELGVAPLPYANVTSPVGNAVTDASGAFTIEDSGTDPVTVVSDVTGQYFVVDGGGGSNTLSLTVTPPGPANFLHQDPADPPERVLAQLNAYTAANEIRDLLLSYVPEYPVIADQTGMPINVNVSGPLCDLSGGAWYDDNAVPRTINFCERTAERANAAFRSIVYHEYGHHIIDSGGSGQGEYGEGMADAISVLVTKDPRIGVGYYVNQCDAPLRTAENDCQYDEASCSSCGGLPYECGSVISSTIWDIWQALEVTEPESADDIIRSLVFSSIPLHMGSNFDESLAIDLLTLDDDDELLENGTPHYDAICAGFAAHNMDCPPIVDGLVIKGVDLEAEGPSGGPFEPESVSYTLHNLGPEPELTYSVVIPSGVTWLSVDSTGGTIALGDTATVTVSIDQVEAALLPDGDYTATIEFVNETTGVGTVSREVKLRVGAPVPIYTATFDDGLEGFTPDTEHGNLWHHSTACADSLPGHSSPGSLYYGKDDVCNYTTPTPILHTITSPEIVIPNTAMAELGFNYLLQTENSSDYDHAQVLLSVDGGPFQIVASNNHGGEKLNETRGWEQIRFGIADLLPATGPTTVRLQFAFNAVDPNSNTDTGFVVDDVTLYAQPVSGGCTSHEECDDGDTCTDDICYGGVCVHSDNGSCTSQGPCAAFCSNPITFATTGYDSFQSGPLGTAGSCHETTGPFNGGVCGNLVHPRRLFVNGVPMKCDWTPWAWIPPRVNGGYCIHTTSGDYPWAAFATW